MYFMNKNSGWFSHSCPFLLHVNIVNYVSCFYVNIRIQILLSPPPPLCPEICLLKIQCDNDQVDTSTNVTYTLTDTHVRACSHISA